MSGAEVRVLVEERRRARDPSQGSALDYVRKLLNKEPVSRATPLEPRIEPSLGRSQWDRIDLADGLELNVRRPLTRQQQRHLDKLLAAAREIFAEP